MTNISSELEYQQKCNACPGSPGKAPHAPGELTPTLLIETEPPAPGRGTASYCGPKGGTG